MKKIIIDDGFNAELVTNAFFEGFLEIPIIEKPKEIVIPSALIPFTQMKRSAAKTEAVHFYEHDKRFSDVLTCTKKLLPELSKFSAVISPDCSLYRDMPLCLQIANTYMNRAVGHYLQSQGLYVIPNIRWEMNVALQQSNFRKNLRFSAYRKTALFPSAHTVVLRAEKTRSISAKAYPKCLTSSHRKWCLFMEVCPNVSLVSLRAKHDLSIIPTGLLRKEGGRYNGRGYVWKLFEY